MHISNTQIHRVFELHLHRVYPAIRPESTAQLPDQLTISRQATEMQSIKQFIAGLPAVREDTVSDLRARIESGDYDVSEPDIAEAMFRAARQERLGA